MADVAEQGHREHRGRVVEPGLPLQHSGQPGRQRQLAQHREHRGGIGRRQHRAQQQRLPPAQVQQPAGRRRDHHHAHHHPHRGQAQRRGTRGAGTRPAGRQPPLGQDQHQRAEAQRLRQPGIIEPDADACLAQGQAQAQEHQQARQADPVRHPGRDDRREHHRGADEQDQTEIASRHAVSASAHPGGMPVATSLPRSAPPAGRSAPPPYASRVTAPCGAGWLTPPRRATPAHGRSSSRVPWRPCRPTARFREERSAIFASMTRLPSSPSVTCPGRCTTWSLPCWPSARRHIEPARTLLAGIPRHGTTRIVLAARSAVLGGCWLVSGHRLRRADQGVVSRVSKGDRRQRCRPSLPPAIT